MHDNNHQDVFWELLNLLITEFRLLIDTYQLLGDVQEFLQTAFWKFWSGIVLYGLESVGGSIWSILGTIGLVKPVTK